MGIWTWLGELLQSGIDAIVSLLSFLGNMVTSIFRLLANIPKMVSLLTTAIGFVPPQYTAFLGATIAVAVMFFITGKER